MMRKQFEDLLGGEDNKLEMDLNISLELLC